MGGAIFETAAVTEVYKRIMHCGTDPLMYFWRTSAGAEVDIVVEFGNRLVPVEIKLSSTPRPAMTSNIKTFQEDFGDKAAPGYVLHTGDIRLPFGPGVTALPFTEL
jgi:hypothetical protein